MQHNKILVLRVILLLFFIFSFTSVNLYSQEYNPNESETNPPVLEKLEWFQDVKFGLMMHWGPYSQWGIVESWSLCSEDEPWCRRKSDNYVEYCKSYEKLKETFNPTDFDPKKWAEATKYAGMKYVVFTTKHHDGFCMFETEQTDYKITDSGCPFSRNPKANITKEIFETFRNEGFGIGVYFSKPDWHSPYYWWPYFATPDRNVNYDPAKYPELWEKFKEFTYSQIEELMSGYGKIDILWLDGGWVRPRSTITDNIRHWAGLKPYNQDIDMPGIAKMARKHQPGLIIVDRTVTGKYENYRTPEQHVPDKPLDYVWETCMTMGNSWSYSPTDHPKSTNKLIHLLVDIVSKGGNFLLNIGPDLNGNFPEEFLKRLQDIGDWMKVNSQAIYNTHPIAPYKEAKTCFTSLDDGTLYAIYLADEDEKSPPSKIIFSTIKPAHGAEIYMLGTNKSLKWERVGKGILIEIPESIIKDPPCKHAWAFCIKKLNE